MKVCLAVVIPCYNAGDRLRPVVEKLIGIADNIYIVDDGSTDGSPQSTQDLDVKIITLPENRGKGFAMLAGFEAALKEPGVEAVTILDADGQHDPAELNGLYSAFVEHGADLLVGERRFTGDEVPWRSKLGNNLTALLARILLKRDLPDTQSGYRLHSRRFVEDILDTVPGGRYEMEMAILIKAVREGYNVASSPIATIYEKGNTSSHFNKLRDSFLIYRMFFLRAMGKVKGKLKK